MHDKSDSALRIQRTIDRLTDLIDGRRASSRCYLRRAALYHYSGQNDLLRKELPLLEMMVGLSADVIGLKGVLALSDRRYRSAEEHLTEALNGRDELLVLGPDYLLFSRALARSRQEKKLEALTDLGRSFCLACTDVSKGRCLSMRADILQELGKTELAAREVEWGLRLNPDFRYLRLQGFRYLHAPLDAGFQDREAAIFFRRLGIWDRLHTHDFQGTLELLTALESEAGCQLELARTRLLCLVQTGISDEEFALECRRLSELAREGGFVTVWASIEDLDWWQTLEQLMPSPDCKRLVFGPKQA